MIKKMKARIILCASVLSLAAVSCAVLKDNTPVFADETQNAVNNVTVAEETKFSMLDGAAVRIDDNAVGKNKAAIRFTTRVKKSEIEGKSNVQIVTMIVPTRYLDENLQNGFDKDDLAQDKVQYVVMSADNMVADSLVKENDATYNTADYYYYNAAIYNVNEANISRAFSARSYLTVNGEVQYYSAFNITDNSRSVFQVAEAKKATLTETDAEYANVSKLCAEYKITAGEETLLTVKRGERLAWYETQLNAAIEELKTPVEDTTNLTYTWAHEVTGLPETNVSINADVAATVTYNVLKMEANGTEAYAVSTGHSLADGIALTVPATFNGLPVNKVADKAFQKNTAITKVILPNSVTYIGSVAFNEASNLKTIVMPGLTSTIANVAQNSFYRCKALREIVVNRLRLKDWQVFATDANSSAVGTANIYCLSTDTSKIEITYSKNNLLSGNIYVYSENKACGYWTWKDGVYGGEIVQTPDHSYTGENGACLYCGVWDAKGISYQYGTIDLIELAGSTYATLNVNGKRVSELTGYIVAGLLDSHTGTTVEIPDTYNDGTNGTANVIAVGSGAFKNNKTITKVVLSKNVIAIEGNAFYGCTALTTAIMPGVIDRYANPGDGGSYIGADAFYNCIALETLVVSSLNQVGQRVFYVDTADYPDYQPKLKAYRYNAEGTAKFGGTFRVTDVSKSNMFAVKTNTSGVAEATGQYYLYSASYPTDEQWTTTSDWWYFDADGNVVVWEKTSA